MNTYIKIKKYINNFLETCDRKFHKRNENEQEKLLDLVQNINSVMYEWKVAKNNFELANTKDSVDYYAYKIKAYEARYQELIKKAKKEGVKAPLICENRVGIYSKK
ncbi:MAG: DUF2508 family protein [Clostridiales bacterium]|nr:DUF2508 family protein [Clostridiales bacterium]